MKTKIKMYWKEDGTKVRSHTRGLNRRKNAPRTIVGSNRGTIKALLFFGMLIVISGIFSWQAKFNEMDAQKAKAKGNTCPVELPLNGATSFESADMPRDTIDRDRSETIEDKIRRVFGKDADMAVAIAKAESGLNEKSVSKPNRNGSIDRGIFQINSVHLWRVGGDSSKLLDRDTNIAVAYEIFKEQNWIPWTVYRTGAYLKYLDK
jgi:hypothetical protein